MGRFKIVIPGKFNSMNQYIAACRTNPRAGASMKKEQQEICELFVRTKIYRELKYPIKLHYFFFETDKRRDHDNVSGFFHKIFQDAIVSCGKLPDDGWKYVIGDTNTFLVDKKNPRIEIIIEEAVDSGDSD